MVITATEFKTNIGKYLTLVASEDIFITRNGKQIARLSNSKQDKVDTMKSLFGIIPNGGETDAKQFKTERLARKYENID